MRRDVEASILVADEATLLLSDSDLPVTVGVKRAQLQPTTTATKQRVFAAFVDGAIGGVTVETCPRLRISIPFWKRSLMKQESDATKILEMFRSDRVRCTFTNQDRNATSHEGDIPVGHFS